MARRVRSSGPLDLRSQAILRAVIEEYVTTAQPVGSQALVERYRIGVSSATVRSVMSELEMAGLLDHPHTSAGRIPTEAGYRYYVEAMIDSAPLPPVEQLMIRHQFGQVEFASEHWFRLAATTLASLTRAAGIATPAKPATRTSATSTSSRSATGWRRCAVVGLAGVAMPAARVRLREGRRGEAEPVLARELDLAELVADHQLLDRGQRCVVDHRLDVVAVARLGGDAALRSCAGASAGRHLQLGRRGGDGPVALDTPIRDALDERMGLSAPAGRGGRGGGERPEGSPGSEGRGGPLERTRRAMEPLPDSG